MWEHGSGKWRELTKSMLRFENQKECVCSCVVAGWDDLFYFHLIRVSESIYVDLLESEPILISFIFVFLFIFFWVKIFFLEQNILESRDSQFPESCVASLKYNNYIDPQEPAGSYFRRALRMIWEQWRRKGFARVKRKKVGERGFNSNIHQWRIKLDWCKISKCNFTTWPRFPKINLDTFCEHTSRRNILSNLVLCTALLFPPSLLALPDEARQIKRTKSNHENNNKLSNLFSATRESNHQTRLQKKRFKKPIKEQNRYQLEQADAPRAVTTRPLTIISEFQQA